MEVDAKQQNIFTLRYRGQVKRQQIAPLSLFK